MWLKLGEKNIGHIAVRPKYILLLPQRHVIHTLLKVLVVEVFLVRF